MPITKSFAGLSTFGFGVMPGGAMESIGTVTVGSGGASSINFTSIPATYQHLQIRMTSRANFNFGSGLSIYVRFNSDTGSNYAWHRLRGDGGSATAAGQASDDRVEFQGVTTDTYYNASIFGGAVIDLLDYGSTSKTKTVRFFGGFEVNGGGIVSVQSGLWNSTSSVSTVTLTSDGNWMQHTTAALYGLRAP